MSEHDQPTGSDQALGLRRLTSFASPRREPTTLVVVGAKGGVGCSTVALALGRAAGEGGALVVDAHWGQSDLTVLASLFVDESQQAAPELLVAARWLADRAETPSDATAERLFERLARERREFTVLDAGPAATPWARALARRADRTLLVATADRVAMVAAYAAAKRLRAAGAEPTLVWNGSSDTHQVQLAHDRIAATCAEAGVEPIASLGWLPARRDAADRRFVEAAWRVAAAARSGKQARRLQLGRAGAA